MKAVNRINFIILLMFAALAVMAWRLVCLQWLQGPAYHALAQEQQEIWQAIMPSRGDIFMQDKFSAQGFAAAINKSWPMAYLEPSLLESSQNKQVLADNLARILQLDSQSILAKMAKEKDPYEPLKHRLSGSEEQAVRDLAIKGVGMRAEEQRFYPGKALAAQVLGFENDEAMGQYGLEQYYDKQLRGASGEIKAERDGLGRWLVSLMEELQPAQDGLDLFLTIEQNVQWAVEKKLARAINDFQAKAGTIIVLAPRSGKVLAMASWPSFDLNNYNQVQDIDVFLNPAVQKSFEPGSVFKPITMAAALEQEVVNPTTEYFDQGFVKVSGETISNVEGEAHGWQTMQQVLEKSLNTGAVFVQQKLGKEFFRSFVQKFGFGQPTGIDLAGEAKGSITNLFLPYDVNFATAAFGQGISVTPMQLVCAYAVLANGGELVQPQIVEKMVSEQGEEDRALLLEPVRVISENTSQTITQMLVSVVDNGYGKKAGVDGYQIAGKTGTAQVASPGGYGEQTIHSFVGYGPMPEPQFVVLVKLDDPQAVRFAADSASLVFKQVMEYLLQFYQIPPRE